jgi:aerobic-type carbon monoxide dehydrogenase small subunit (CoxS/CutS family)
MIDTIKFKLNDKPSELKVDGERRLLWVLRSDLGRGHRQRRFRCHRSEVI